MKPVDVTDKAQSDLLTITDSLSDFSAPAALAFVTRFEKALQQLRELPESGRPRRNSKHANRRVLHVGVYDYLYEVTAETVVLRRILDGRRLRKRP